MADKNFLSESEAASLLFNAERKKKAGITNEVVGFIPHWPSPEVELAILTAAQNGDRHVVLDRAGKSCLFELIYYKDPSHRFYSEDGAFFLKPIDFGFTPCGWFTVERLKLKTATKKVMDGDEVLNAINN